MPQFAAAHRLAPTAHPTDQRRLRADERSVWGLTRLQKLWYNFWRHRYKIYIGVVFITWNHVPRGTYTKSNSSGKLLYS